MTTSVKVQLYSYCHSQCNSFFIFSIFITSIKLLETSRERIVCFVSNDSWVARMECYSHVLYCLELYGLKMYFRPYSIPAFVSERYNFPIKTRHHHEASPHCQTAATEAVTLDDMMTSSVVTDRLRVLWNVAWYEGLESLLETTSREKSFTEDSAHEKWVGWPIRNVLIFPLSIGVKTISQSDHSESRCCYFILKHSEYGAFVNRQVKWEMNQMRSF